MIIKITELKYDIIILKIIDYRVYEEIKIERNKIDKDYLKSKYLELPAISQERFKKLLLNISKTLSEVI